MVDIGVPDEEIETDSRASGREDIIGCRDDLLAVDEPREDVAMNRRLDHVAILHSIVRTDELCQRGEIADLAIPAHDLGVATLCLEAPPEHLVTGADMR